MYVVLYLGQYFVQRIIPGCVLMMYGITAVVCYLPQTSHRFSFNMHRLVRFAGSKAAHRTQAAEDIFHVLYSPIPVGIVQTGDTTNIIASQQVGETQAKNIGPTATSKRRMVCGAWYLTRSQYGSRVTLTIAMHLSLDFAVRYARTIFVYVPEKV